MNADTDPAPGESSAGRRSLSFKPREKSRNVPEDSEHSGNRELSSEDTSDTRLPVKTPTIVPASLTIGFTKHNSFKASWIHSLFGKDDRFVRDWDSTDLEAYIAEGDGHTRPIRLPFGHQRLHYGLNMVLKSRSWTPWSKYLSIDPQKRRVVDKVTTIARASGRQRKTCLAVDECEVDGHPSYLLVFFSVDDKEPEEPVILRDGMGSKYIFPYELCRTWKVSSMVSLY